MFSNKQNQRKLRKSGAEHSEDADIVSLVSVTVSRLTGIQLGDRQYSMVKARLSSRLHQLGLSEKGYLDYFVSMRRRKHRSLFRFSPLTTPIFFGNIRILSFLKPRP